MNLSLFPLLHFIPTRQESRKSGEIEVFHRPTKSQPSGPLVQTDGGTYPTPTTYRLRSVQMYEAEVRKRLKTTEAKLSANAA